MGCWSASIVAPPGVSAALAQAALLPLWSCPSLTNCTGSGLPAGVLPTATLSDGRLTIFPAPPDLTPSCAPAVLSASGATAPMYCSAYPSTSLPWGAGAWTAAPVLCVGAGAQRLSPHMLLDTAVGGGPPVAGGGPITLDWANIWDPALLDSFNQNGPDTVVREEWLLYPNGTVRHHYHFQAEYIITGRFCEAYPFDKSIFVATRRAFTMLPTDILVSIEGGPSMPQEMDAWSFQDMGVVTCPTHKIAGQSTDDCGEPGSEACSQMMVMWLRMVR